MGLTYYIAIVALLVLGLIFKKKNIKDIKLLNFSFSTVFIIIYITAIIIIELIIPIPTYYIKAKGEFFIETIIENEMTRSNIPHDHGTLEVVNQFIGKYNQLYLSKYEVNGVEEARMFDFKENIFGNLKPRHEFSESKVILKSEIDDGFNFRRIGDGFAKFFIHYGYANNPEALDSFWVNKYNRVNLNPESYYLIVERTDGFELLYLIIYSIIFFIIIHRKIKSENKKETYKETVLSWKRLKILEVEYFV